jgi:hypothetical protein
MLTWLWRIPGTLREGEAKSIRSDGYGRTRRYFLQKGLVLGPALLFEFNAGG